MSALIASWLVRRHVTQLRSAAIQIRFPPRSPLLIPLPFLHPLYEIYFIKSIYSKILLFVNMHRYICFWLQPVKTMQLKCIFSLALFYLSLTFVLNFCIFCCILLPSYELNQLDKIPQTCLERWGEHHQTGSSSSALNLAVLVHSHILLSPLPPNKTHQSSIMNDFPKGICHETPPHSLLIHLSFQRVKMNSSLSILDGAWRELWDLTITDCEDWLFVNTLSIPLFHP